MPFHPIRKPNANITQTSDSASQFAPQPFSVQPAQKPLTEEERENQAFEQDKFEATGLQLKEKFGTITPVEQERLGVLQAKMDSFWIQRKERTKAQPNLLEILTQNALATPTTELAAPIQPKLTIGEPNDQYEQEADYVAERVMSMTPPATPNVQPHSEQEEHFQLQTKPLVERITPIVQRQEELEDEQQVQARGETYEQEEEFQGVLYKAALTPDGIAQVQPDLESRLNSTQGGGNPLPDEVRTFMEPRFGTDFSQVRVHTDSESIQMNQDLNAQAFTHRQDIYFGTGKHPGNDALTAHELTHVVQQTGMSALQSAKANPDQIQRESSQIPSNSIIQRSPLSEELRQVWTVEGKAAFFARLHSLQTSDQDLFNFIQTELTGDDRWLAQNILLYGSDYDQWPIDQRIRLAMKPWHVGGGDKGEVFDILRTANGAQANNAALTRALADIFAAGSEDLWYGQNLQIYGSESNWPSDAQENWGHALTARTQAPGQTPPSRHWPAGSVPPELLVGTQTPTSAERTAITQSLTPVATVGGALPTFQPNHSVHGSYEVRIRQFLQQWIDNKYANDVVGRGRTQHANPANVHPMSRFEEIGNAAKQEVDAVFGSYASGPTFVAGTNLFDQWQEYDEEVWGTPGAGGVRTGGLNTADKIDKARDLISYVLSQDEDISTINNQHGAVITRTTPPPSGGDAEATILDRVRAHFATTQTTRLLQIDRAWPATAGGGMVNIQTWRDSTDEGNRRIFWDAFQTMIHEYLHTLAHPDYEAHANTFGYEAAEYNTLMEGVDSLLTETVWANVSGRVSEPTLRQAVEGTAYASQPFNPSVIPSIEDQRYSSYAQAKNLVNIVGINNLYAAYFLGQVDLIRGA